MHKSTYDRAPRRANTPPVGDSGAISPTEFARRHVIYRLNSTKGLIVMAVASQVDPRTGKARTVQKFIAEDLGKTLSTIKTAMQWLLSIESGPVLAKGGGRTYMVVGFLDHDPATCGNVECRSDVINADRGDRKRALARERARRHRAKRASESR